MPENPKKPLERRAKNLCNIIFRYLPCVYCLLDIGEEYTRTVPHHILNKGFYDHLRFKITNIIPLCQTHHNFAHDVKVDFLLWMQERLPEHYRHYLNEKDNKRPVRQTLADLQDIIDDLQYYVDHTIKTEKLIYEKD